ncbi:MAG: hypothetical protein KDA32_09560 [Phycisphaerales bacterium]|nr:hypothetical protein [Phycisphaerales bacterium]
MNKLTLIAVAALAAPVLAQPASFKAEGHDSRIDLTWDVDGPSTPEPAFNVYRAESAEGPFKRINTAPHPFTVYSDFLGANDKTCYYRVALIGVDGAEGTPSPVVSAKTRAMSDDELLTSIQKATFRYFWDFGHPVSGLSREGVKHPRDTVTSGGTGFGLMTIIVGAERGFVSREAAAERILKMVRFLDEKTPRYHGVWSHWINGVTGETIPFAGKEDNGGDIVESAFLVEGLLTVAQYFDRDNSTEREIRERVAKMWREVEWDWQLRTPEGRQLYWHWSPQYEWHRNFPIGGHFNECMIAYILGICSPTHAIPAECYYEGWVKDPTTYANGKEFYGVKQPLGYDYGGPLFFTHYSYLGLDPRAVTDRFCNYFENNRAISQIHYAYCKENPKEFKGYGDSCWGLTASFSVNGYVAHQPMSRDNGTITPTAAISAMPYTPEESMKALKHFYHDLGPKIWGPFGFHDAFNEGHDWVSDTYLAIDQGTICPMIENYRSGLCWRMFMKNGDIGSGLRKAALLTPNYSPPSGKAVENTPN